MQQWEYLGVRLIPEADHGRITILDPHTLKGTPLNEMGRKGWEVVGVFRDNFWVLLKRPLEAASATPEQAASKEAVGTSGADTPTNLLPTFGYSDEARERELEEKLQREMQRRQGGGRR